MADAGKIHEAKVFQTSVIYVHGSSTRTAAGFKWGAEDEKQIPSGNDKWDGEKRILYGNDKADSLRERQKR